MANCSNPSLFIYAFLPQNQRFRDAAPLLLGPKPSNRPFKRQNSEAFQAIYAQRAGVEGTLSQAIRRSDLRHARYRGMQKTHLQHIFIALAINLVRVFDWFAEKPLARTCHTQFAKLALAA